MPYRRLPKTDAARLRALKTLLDNNDIYTVRNRFIDWKTLNRAQPAYDRLLTASEQYKVSYAAQLRGAGKGDKLQRNATMYVSHFVQVLLMSVERGEIKKSNLKLYGLDESTTSLPNIKTISGLIKWGTQVVEGEKARIKKGGRPIFNPTIGMVSTHLDIFKENNDQQKRLQDRTAQALEALKTIRPEVDSVLLELWNQIEENFKNEPPEVRFAECRKYGIIYYYRRKEEHLY
ncbi:MULTISPECIES: hypothetical protein [Prevotellaceae]|jgi:hypothetical protein|uniref:Uncharacterized protein n=1 Tax=Xylanibacter rarus TaxID=1676614 RepID=A0A8E1R1P9_9BACT|nr:MULTISPECIES: hypothetical protein [Prevotellaceae]KOO69909.1 hypothetical protein ACU52_01410 [Xylanibacter rarus]CCX69281.1 uncharacterized protein BN567_00593 [Prevotella sp. CAG:255]